MINKEVNSSERERESNNYTKSTTIDLNNINEKVRNLECKTRTVPITMKNLDDRINNLVATAKNFKYCRFSSSVNMTGTVDITNQFGGYPISSRTKVIAVLDTNNYGVRIGPVYIENKTGDFTLSGGNNEVARLIRQGNKFKTYYNSNGSSGTYYVKGFVMLYD